MSQFKRMNIIGGWIVFAIAFATYLLTLEPAASLWDCGEFIATSYKLEVGHPPGTPFFFLINRLGAMFAPTVVAVAPIINGLSALESALTIAFLFWSISHLARRIYRRDEQELTSSQGWATLAAATIGSLAYTFSDTFWFSAVEAEVYALSSLFTAVVFWAILKWEEVADQPGSNRWLILIAYLMGLSIGAHILNLLTIPALVFIYYFKKYPARKYSQLWKPAMAAVLLLGAFYMITPFTLAVGVFFDRIFVNSFNLPINSGLITVVILMVAALVYGVYVTQKAGRVGMNTIIVSTLTVVIGFSTYGIVLIRAAADPPMNNGDPSNPVALKSFVNREQYGSNPLLYGETYASPAVDIKPTTGYMIVDGKYVSYESIKGYKYDPNSKTLFPRLWSASGSHIQGYKSWGQVTGHKKRMQDGTLVTLPTFGENLRYFFSYQVNFMYWRYFLWNFVGRQNDVQSSGNILDGNWLSGIKPLDQAYLGPQDGMPAEMANNRGHNTYFFLPFILGLAGLLFQLKRDGKNFLVVGLLFFMTGIAIILYLNQPPFQPRERDYAYAGSFYAFAIWIGLGLLPLYEKFAQWFRNNKAAVAVSFLLCCSVPVLLATQNWDDHDRSGRTIARDAGYAYLNSTKPNSIIINYGDNDTFPIWYTQEVEGYRTDVRVMNFSYISGDWYIDKMRSRENESAPLPISLPRSKYTGDASMIFPIKETPKPGGGDWTAKEVMEIVNSEDPRTKVRSSSGDMFDFIPARRIALPVNKQSVVNSGILSAADVDQMEDTIYITLKGERIGLPDLILLDILANNDWERPVHFTAAAGLMDLGLMEYSQNDRWSYLQHDGAAYTLVPIKTPISRGNNIGRIETESLYDRMMNQFGYGNVKDEKVYLDAFVETTLKAIGFRNTFARLAIQLAEEGDTVRAKQVLDRAIEELPPSQLKYDEAFAALIEGYWRIGEQETGDRLADEYTDMMFAYLDYFEKFEGKKAEYVEEAYEDKVRLLYWLYDAALNSGQNERAMELQLPLQSLLYNQ